MGGNRNNVLRTPSNNFFVIVFEGRTGSSYTVSCLNSHQDVWCYPEILAHQNGGAQRKILKGIAQGHKIEKMSQVVLNKRYFTNMSEKKGPFGAVGFKTKLQDVWHVSHFYDYLHRHKFRLIYLKRRNIIKSALSMLNAHRLVGKFGDGHWNASRKEHIQGAFYVSADALLAQLQRRIRLEKWHQRFFDLYEADKIQLSYEGLLEDEKQFRLRLLGFLGVELKTLHGGFFKNTPDKLQDAILNYAEIRNLFVHTHFERFFDDMSDL